LKSRDRIANEFTPLSLLISLLIHCRGSAGEEALGVAENLTLDLVFPPTWPDRSLGQEDALRFSIHSVKQSLMPVFDVKAYRWQGNA